VLRSRDILLVTTRPPLDDDPEYAKKTIDRSSSALERNVFAGLRRILQNCARDHVKLTDDARQALRARGGVPYGDAAFESYEGARWKGASASDRRTDTEQTLGYLLAVPEIWPRGPKALAVFALGGTETLIWAYLLATRHRDVLKKSIDSRRLNFAIGDFTWPKPRTSAPLPAGIWFADGAVVKIVQCELNETATTLT
jgi:hypothetical protein